MHVKSGERFKAEGGGAELAVVELLDEGRTAEVYLAHASGEDSEDCALKLVRALPRASLAKRNARSVQARAALALLGEHPGIARGGPGGWHQGRAFFSMELLAGPTLAHVLISARHSYRARMAFFSQVCAAVAHCHARGLIHRDLRPGNFTVEAERGAVLSHFESSLMGAGEEGSRVGVGAAEYAHPDYLAYVLEPSTLYVNTPRADVYALGKLLFPLLTGRQPVERAGRSRSQYLMALRDWEPFNPARLNAEAPPACAALALALLSRDGPVTAEEVLLLVQEAVAEDDGALHAMAPPIKALPETLLSSVRLTARRSISEDWRVRLDRVGQLSRQYAPLAAMVAGCATFNWFGWNAMREESARLARAVAHLEALVLEAAQRPPAPLAEQLLARARMPERPDPTWLRPNADGLCHDPVSGRELPTTFVLRDACWIVSVKNKPEQVCSEGSFEAPPEVETTPQLQRLRNHCFSPVINVQPQASKLEK